jgi:hypothetical protein
MDDDDGDDDINYKQINKEGPPQVMNPTSCSVVVT